MTRPELAVDLCGIRLSNPLILAAGILGTGAELLERVARAGAGAVTAKSCGPEPRAGHLNPTVLDWGHGLINAIGLANPGVEEMAVILRDAKSRLKPLSVPLIASIFAETVEGFAEVARRVSKAEPDFIEVNISCPNVAAEFGRPFAADPDSAAAVTEAVKGTTHLPIIVKLSPNVTDVAAIAQAVETAGADAIAAINTVAGMVIDVDCGQPILANRVGGLSGPAIRPIAVRCVYEIPGCGHPYHRPGWRGGRPGCCRDDHGRCHGRGGRVCRLLPGRGRFRGDGARDSRFHGRTWP